MCGGERPGTRRAGPRPCRGCWLPWPGEDEHHLPVPGGGAADQGGVLAPARQRGQGGVASGAVNVEYGGPAGKAARPAARVQATSAGSASGCSPDQAASCRPWAASAGRPRPAPPGTRPDGPAAGASSGSGAPVSSSVPGAGGFRFRGLLQDQVGVGAADAERGDAGPAGVAGLAARAPPRSAAGPARPPSPRAGWAGRRAGS